MYLLIFIYKYNIRRTQISESTVSRRGFSDKALTRVRIKENMLSKTKLDKSKFYYRKLSTHRD